MNVTTASNPIENVIRDSTETFSLNFGKTMIPPTIAPTPNDPNRSPKPIESRPRSCFANSGKRDNKALLHKVNKPTRIIKACAALEYRMYLT